MTINSQIAAQIAQTQQSQITKKNQLQNFSVDPKAISNFEALKFSQIIRKS